MITVKETMTTVVYDMEVYALVDAYGKDFDTRCESNEFSRKLVLGKGDIWDNDFTEKVMNMRVMNHVEYEDGTVGIRVYAEA